MKSPRVHAAFGYESKSNSKTRQPPAPAAIPGALRILSERTAASPRAQLMERVMGIEPKQHRLDSTNDLMIRAMRVNRV